MLGKVIDVTFHGGREQSEILKEIDSEVTSVTGGRVNTEDEKIPDVVTYDTIKEFCLEVIKDTPKSEQKKRRVYAGIIKILDENIELKEENRKLKIEELKSQETDANEVIKGIEEDEKDNK